ncbi:MAG: tetratricopeptide repeat protein [Alphaproteobacteria bacterium]|nr:tetratricopeptide repeat protein [Alphaproteobacteria bacterium]
MSTHVDPARNSGQTRSRLGLGIILGCLAVLGVAACGAPAVEEPVSDDQAVQQQNARATELMQFGNTLRAQGNLNEAAGVYSRAMNADPDSPLPPAALGDTLRQLKRYDEAEQVFRQALERNPYSGMALQGIGILLIERKQPDAAVAMLTPAVDENAADHRVYNVLGIAYDALGDHTQAQNQYLAGLDIQPENKSLRNNMALSLVLQERYDAAVEQVQRLLTGTEADEPYLHNLALVYGLAGRIESAAALLRQMLPEADVANNLAYYQNLRALPPDRRRAAILDIVLQSIFLSSNGTTSTQGG